MGNLNCCSGDCFLESVSSSDTEDNADSPHDYYPQTSEKCMEDNKDSEIESKNTEILREKLPVGTGYKWQRLSPKEKKIKGELIPSALTESWHMDNMHDSNMEDMDAGRTSLICKNNINAFTGDVIEIKKENEFIESQILLFLLYPKYPSFSSSHSTIIYLIQQSETPPFLSDKDKLDDVHPSE
ncbi:hypothetical protein E5288_WYG009283 [Bos mutus]|uniref:Uncharacterized protein n=1 Tax=Bos mutus TaxID=72004 RepID=A0A6B0S547_9CETA|nr:hypothetical protein [Bos mutus]